MSATLINIVLIALGGGLGGMARFWVAGVMTQRYGARFPWGTLVVNVSGAGCIGVVAGLLLADDASRAGQVPLWAGLVAGLLGSYTTVSSFSLQTLALMHAGQPLRAGLNVVGSVVLCLAAAAAGYGAAGAGL